MAPERLPSPPKRCGPADPSWLTQFYDAYPRIEEEFHVALGESLNPRGPELLYEVVSGFGLPSGSVAVDVGCGDGKHSLELAGRFRFSVTGIDPVPRHEELANARLAAFDALHPEVGRLVRFRLGVAEALPFEDRSVDLVWCRDVLLHVAEPNKAYAEFQRVLREGGHVLVYQMFGTDRLEPREADWLWKTMGVVPTSAERDRTDAAIAAAGLRVEDRIDLGPEWGERAEEETGSSSNRLLYAARLLRDPQRYIAQFGQAAYDIMLGDCLWHVYAMIGKLDRRVYLLSRGGSD